MALRHYVLLATDGFIQLPTTGEACAGSETNEQIYVFGFTGGLYRVNNTIIDPTLDYNNSENWPGLMAQMGKATIPSPIIWGDVGDRIYVTLINLGMKELPDLLDFHSVHLHGAHVATQIDGFPESSFGVPMWTMTEPLGAPPNATYLFRPEHPGTYMYHCHVEASEHVQMGMYGALIIYPSVASLGEAGITQDSKGRWRLHGKKQRQIPKTATNRNFAYNDIHTYFASEWVMLLSEIDSAWHNAVLNELDFNAVDFKPNYWLVNGRAFPDTLYPHPQTSTPDSNSNLTQISYESYVHIKTNEKFLLRMINMGYQVVPWHIHGWHFMVIGKDTHPSPFLAIAHELDGEGHGMHEMGFTATIGSGETYDLLLTADDKRDLYRKYIVNGQDGFPSLCDQLDTLQAIDPGSIFEIPTEPVQCPNPQTVNYVNICHGTQGVDNFFPQFYPAHNHDDYKVTNNGTYPGGQLIYIQTDAPDDEEQDGHGH